MAEKVYIVIPNWNRFQHYKDRDPTWIKNYTRLLSDDGYADLSLHRRGILHGLWMEYARSNRQLPGDTLTLTRRLGGRVSTRDLEALNHAGFIEFSASPPALAPRYPSRAPAHSQEAETEAEEELDKDLHSLNTEANYAGDDIDFDTAPANGNGDRRWTTELDIPRLGETRG